MIQSNCERVLVTGASGFIGRYVVKELQKQGKAAIGMGRKKAPDLTCVSWQACDLLEQQTTVNLNFFPDTCIHLAWPVGSDYANSTANEEFLKASINLIDSLLQRGCKHFVIAGTCAEYGKPTQLPVKETLPPNPDTHYALSKNSLRLALEDRLKNCPDVTLSWARIFQLYGPGEHSDRLFPSMAEAFTQQQPFLAASGAQFRGYLHVHDVARALVLLAIQRSQGIYNISSGLPIQLAELMHIFAHHFAPEATIELNAKEERQGWSPSAICGDNTKLRALGWTPSIALEDGLKSYADFLRGKYCL